MNCGMMTRGSSTLVFWEFRAKNEMPNWHFLAFVSEPLISHERAYIQRDKIKLGFPDQGFPIFIRCTSKGEEHFEARLVKF